MAEPRECRHCKEVKIIKAHGFCSKCYARILRHGTPEKRSRKKATICTFCGKEGKIIKGLCKRCYERKAKTGTVEYTKVKKKCKVEGCDNWRVSHGLCDKHRQRVINHGTYYKARPNDWGKKEKHPLINVYRWMMKQDGMVDIYELWKNDFWKFVEDVGEKPFKNCRFIKRVDDEGYFPKNCHWVEMEPNQDKAKYMKEWRLKNVDHVKNKYLQKRFGITLDEYNEMSEEQNGVCKICGNPEKINGSLAVDHCHSCGKIRGLLCSKCNRAISWLADSPTRLMDAAIYLEQSGCNSDRHKLKAV